MKLRKTSLLTKIVILALVVYAGISLVSLKLQTSQAQAKRNELQTQVDEVMQTNSELEYATQHSTDNETIEDIARNKIGLVKPGEKIFLDVSN